jgi:predicted MFS family arabinose efflux permease
MPIFSLKQKLLFFVSQLISAAGIGTLVGGLIIGRFKGYSELSLLSAALLCDGIILALFSMNSYFPVSLILFGIMGIVGAFMGSLLRTAIQKQTPSDMLGRVSGFISTVVEPLSVMSILVGGIFSSLIEIKYIFFLCAIAELVTGLYFVKKHTSISIFNRKQ